MSVVWWQMSNQTITLLDGNVVQLTAESGDQMRYTSSACTNTYRVHTHLTP